MTSSNTDAAAVKQTMMGVFAPVGGGATSRSLTQWSTFNADIVRNIFDTTRSEMVIMQTVRLLHQLVTAGGYDLYGPDGRRITTPWVLEKYDQFVFDAIVYYVMFGMIQYRGQVRKGHLLPCVPDVNTGVYIRRLHPGTREPMVAWANMLDQHGRVVPIEGQKHLRPDRMVVVHTWLAPNYVTPTGFDSLISSLLQESAFNRIAQQNWARGDYARTHPDTYFTFSRKDDVNNVDRGAQAGSGKRVAVPVHDVKRAALAAQQDGVSTQQSMSAMDAHYTMQQERIAHAANMRSGRSARGDVYETFTEYGESATLRAQRSYEESVPLLPGFTPTRLTQPSPTDRIVELREHWNRMVQTHLGLPPESYRSHVSKGASAGGSAGADPYSASNKRLHGTVVMMRDRVSSLMTSFFLHYEQALQGEDKEVGDPRLMEQTPAERVLDNMVAEIIQNMRTGTEQTQESWIMGTEREPVSVMWERAEEPRPRGPKPGGEEDGEPLPFRNLLEFLQYMRDKGILEQQPMFANAREHIRRRLEQDIMEDVTILANRIYGEALRNGHLFDSSVIRSMILDSDEFRRRFEELDATEEAPADSDAEFKPKMRFEWRLPPLFDPQGLLELSSRGLVDQKTAVHTHLKYLGIPDGDISKYMAGIDYKALNDLAAGKPAPEPPGAGPKAEPKAELKAEPKQKKRPADKEKAGGKEKKRKG